MRTLILHSLKMRKVLTASVMLAVAVSAAALFALGLTYGGVQQGVAASAQRGGAQMMVVAREVATEVSDTALLFTGAPAPVYLPAALLQDIEDIAGVERTTSQFFSQSLDESCCSIASATRLIGVDFASDWTVQPFSSRDVSKGLSDTEVVVGSGVAGEVGQTISLLGKTFAVVERLAPSGSALDGSMLLDIEVARDMSVSNQGLSHLWNKYGAPQDLVSCVLVDLDGSVDVNLVKNRINALGNAHVIQRSEVIESSQKQLETVFFILLGAGVLMLASTLVQLFARFYSCVWERKSELALYRAVGASKAQVRLLIGGEVAAIVGVGLLAGFVGGAVLFETLTGMLQDASAFPFIALGAPEVVGLILGMVLLFAALAFVAVVVPLVQIGRLDPSLAMQQGDIG